MIKAKRTRWVWFLVVLAPCIASILNFVKRNLSSIPKAVRSTAYQSSVRPILEYGHTVWDPYQKNHIATLEQVQRRAARYVTGNYSTYSSVTSMLVPLDWLSIQERRCAARPGLLHKARAGKTAVKLPPYVQVPTSQSVRGHQTWNYSPIRASTVFFPRTIRCCNILPASFIRTPLISARKSWAALQRSPLSSLTRETRTPGHWWDAHLYPSGPWYCSKP